MKDYESRLKLVIPNRGQIEIKGKTEFVDMFFQEVLSRFGTELGKAIKTFQGDLEIVETQSDGKTEIQIVEKEKSK